jgi:Mor family transcriptional regulator
MNSKAALKKLRELVGEATYSTIVYQLAGTTVYFPSNTEFTDLEERNMQIRDDFYSGDYDVADLARKYNLSISRIYKIIQSR